LQMESGLRRCGKEAREERKQGHSLPSRCSFLNSKDWSSASARSHCPNGHRSRL
jgi:hypothetical protein